MTIVRIRDSNPTIETTSSNLTFRLGALCNDDPFEYASITLQNNRTPYLNSVSNVNSTFFRMLQTPEGVALCSVEPLFPEARGNGFQPTLSFMTGSQTERARIDAAGMWTTHMRADSYLDLANDYITNETTRPASAYALSSAYSTLSNMIQTFVGSNAILFPPSAANVRLLDSYTSASITDAPTAGALRRAYISLSNTTQSRYSRLSNMIPNLVYTATISALAISGSTITPGNNEDVWTTPGQDGGFVLSNSVWLRSYPDRESRLFFGPRGETVFAAGGDFAAGGSFRWHVNDLDKTVGTLNGDGDLWTSGSVSASANVSAGDSIEAASNVACQRLIIGDIPVTSAGRSNIGINLPPGVAPQHALHVNGMVFSDEGVYAMSDAREKRDITPLTGALDRLRQIRGYSYEIRGRRRLGVLAQEVQSVAPEAVIETSETIGVSYADLLALVVEAIHELTTTREGEGRIGDVGGPTANADGCAVP